MSEERVEIRLNDREQRLYDRLRGYIASGEFGRRSGLPDMLLLLPDLGVLLFRLARDPRVPFGPKLIVTAALGYLVSPIDLLPGLLLGPLGLLDDLVLVAAALSRVMKAVHPDLLRDHWSGQGDALEAIQRVTSWSEALVLEALPSAVLRLLPFPRRAG